MWTPDPPEKVEHLDVDTTGRAVDDALLWDGTQHVYGAAGLDPDQPLDYLTFTDTATGDTVVAEITNGAWVLTAIDRRVTEDGDVRITESGNVRILED